jgi:hypothetical protein
MFALEEELVESFGGNLIKAEKDKKKKKLSTN